MAEDIFELIGPSYIQYVQAVEQTSTSETAFLLRKTLVLSKHYLLALTLKIIVKSFNIYCK